MKESRKSKGTRQRARVVGGRWALALAVVAVVVSVPAGGALAGRTSPAGVAAGVKLYRVWCAGCHGVKGDGNGDADPDLAVKPRDFTRGKFEIRMTSTANPISNAELFETITAGVPGTSMPAFAFLPERDRKYLAEYVAVLGRLPNEEVVEEVPVGEPPPPTADMLTAGAELYRDLGCPVCHGEAGKGDGPASPALKDEWGNMSPARDLTREAFHGGDSPRDLYLRLVLGMPGTPMPSYAEAADEEQLWALVAYVRSMRVEPEPPPGDLVDLGKWVIEREHCTACHTLNGGGGRIGPSLDLAARKLNFDWTARFLSHPARQPKIYPGLAARMPDLDLSAEEIAGVLAALAAEVARPFPGEPAPVQDPGTAAHSSGRALFARKCAGCHQFDGGPVPATAAAGPDLGLAAQRLDYDFLLPLLIDHTAVAGSDLTAKELRSLAAVVWGESSERLKQKAQGRVPVRRANPAAGDRP